MCKLHITLSIYVYIYTWDMKYGFLFSWDISPKMWGVMLIVTSRCQYKATHFGEFDDQMHCRCFCCRSLWTDLVFFLFFFSHKAETKPSFIIINFTAAQICPEVVFHSVKNRTREKKKVWLAQNNDVMPSFLPSNACYLCLCVWVSCMQG